MLNCLNYLKGQECQLPNIRTMLATITLLYLGYLRALPTWYRAHRRGRGEQLIGRKAVLASPIPADSSRLWSIPCVVIIPINLPSTRVDRLSMHFRLA
jgi:hypothetical protein